MNLSIIKRNRKFLLETVKENPQKELPHPGSLSGYISNRRFRACWDSIEVVVDVLEARDAYTAYHSKNVARMALRMCIVSDFSIAETEKTLMAALAHDLGKIGISDSALKKNGPLTEEEWKEIRRHPDIGAGIIQKAYHLDEIADIIRHHHERWDGKGYPAGLRGEEIPICARVIALCDSVDAMLTHRVYRDALPVDYCKNELQKNENVMYDPKLTEIFLKNWDYIVGDLYTGDMQNV